MTQNRFKTTLTIIYLAQNVIINYSLFLANIYAYSDSTTFPTKQIKYLRNLDLDIFMKRT
jgi:hypothetical protein